jgi:pimeloyl-ACP methyl ester carboxylesterase
MVQSASGPAAKNVVLVHGAFADDSSWSKITPLLQAEGFRVTAVGNPLTSFADDVAATKRALAAQDGPTVLVGHSYGGVVITEAGNDPKEETLRDSRAARSRRHVRGDVVHASVCVSGNCACRRDDCCTSVVQHIDDSRADALRAGGDERAAPCQFEIEAHGAISSRAILSPSRVKRYWRSTGLPGKSPVTRPVTVVWSPETWAPSRSTV